MKLTKIYTKTGDEGETSSDTRERVIRARKIQEERFANETLRYDTEPPAPTIRHKRLRYALWATGTGRSGYTAMRR